jgi:hypothetical protein
MRPLALTLPAAAPIPPSGSPAGNRPVHTKKRIMAAGRDAMPMIDVTAANGTFGDRPALTKTLAEVMRWEKVPAIDLFSADTAAFIRVKHWTPAQEVIDV